MEMSPVLEIRFFTVRPGSRDEFDRVSREGTVPLMRRCGIDVVAYGPTLNDQNGWLLIRAFASEEDRLADSAGVYATAEWLEHYASVVPPLIEDYRTAVLPATVETIELVRGHAR